MNIQGWQWLIILLIVLLLFGAPKLPRLAKSAGESMRIFKSEVKTMRDDEKDDDTQEAGERPAVEGPVIDPTASHDARKPEREDRR